MPIVRIVAAIFCCGLGHILKRDFFRGILFAVGFLSAVGIMIVSGYYDTIHTILFFSLGLCLALGVWLYTIFDILESNTIKKKKAVIEEASNDDYIKGISLYLKNKNKESIENYKKILKNNKKDPFLYYQLSKLYGYDGQKKLAKKMYKKTQIFDAMPNFTLKKHMQREILFKKVV